MEIPVYVFTGLLDSGKTSFINDTMRQPDFRAGERIMVISCEEGEEEFETKACVYVEEEEEFNSDFINSCIKKYDPTMIMVEYNGMWQQETLYDAFVDTPGEIYQAIMTVDAATFEKFKMADMIIFNRCDDNTPAATYRRSALAVNSRTQVFFERTDGKEFEMEDLLPFDVTKEIIEIEDAEYGIWFVDAQDNPARYDGKKIQMKTQIRRSNRLPKTGIYPGRKIMTCCADDIAFYAYPCNVAKAHSHTLNLKNLEDGTWATLVAEVHKRGEYIMLNAISLERATAPKEEVVNF
jgi:uncharacterized membrane protein YcgQ (UPF0703/DUF1980 family)